MSNRERKKGLYLICVVFKWQNVKRWQKKTRKKTAAGKGRLLQSCGEKFPVACTLVKRTRDAGKKRGPLGRKVELGNPQVWG